MDPIFLLLAFAIVFAGGAVCGYACRAVIAKDVAEAHKTIQEAKAVLAEIKAEIKAKV